jgi:predicted nucleic acid-binding protein
MTATESDGDSSKAIKRAPIIFLDTNTVHYIRLALALAQESGIRIEDCDSKTFESCIGSSGIHKKANINITAGYHIGRYLVEQVKQRDARVYYAPVSGFELLCGGLRGHAVLNAAKCGVPHRWYSNLGEDELLHHLGKKDFQDNHSDHANLSSLFQDQLGFSILEPKESDLGKVFDVAQTILSAMYLELGDCLVYASALLARASEIITSDSHLRRAVAGIENPGAAKELYKPLCEYAREQIGLKLADLLDIKQSEALFPTAQTVGELDKKQPRGNPCD